MLDNPMHPMERRREQWQEALLAARSSLRCGAKTRQGSSCRSPAMKNGRCRMHGGRSRGAPLGESHGLFKHGLCTRKSLRFYEGIKKVLKDTRTAIRD
tara:strand:+ start:2233 stop:2526 length:294 start_codon:yes stop_codon:yes gene_type:complete